MKKKRQSVLTSSESEEHYTPRSITDPIRAMTGGITLDPFSCRAANDDSVRASRFFTKNDDGLSQPWGSVEKPSVVFANPPGGKKGMAAKCWNYGAREYAEGRVDILFWMVFNYSTIQVSIRRVHAGLPTMVDGAICYFKERVKYLHEADDDPLTGKQHDLFTRERSLVLGESPLHPSALVMLPSHTAPEQSIHRFIESFETRPEKSTQTGLVRYDPRVAFNWVSPKEFKQ